MRRTPFLAVAAAVAIFAGTVHGQEEPTPTASPSAARAVGSGRFAALSNALALYSPFESPWAEIRANHTVELRLFALMRAEVRMWDLQEALVPQDGPARDDAAEIGRIVHEQILAGAAEALPLLQKTPNRPFALLLVHQLEAYPSEWKQEGSEELLPSLHKLTDPPVGNPPAESSNNRRRRRRIPVPTPAAPSTASPTVRP